MFKMFKFIWDKWSSRVTLQDLKMEKLTEYVVNKKNTEHQYTIDALA